MHVETGIVAGGGSILHDPDQGIYFGTLDLAFRGGLTMQAICLIGTKLPDGTKGSRSSRFSPSSSAIPSRSEWDSSSKDSAECSP